MKIKTKLLCSFLILSSLILIAGMIFYVQLRNLVEPLTPKSIPKSIELLERTINKNNAIHNYLYQQQLTQYHLEHYVFTDKTASLQNYYLHQALLDTLLNTIKKTDPSLWQELVTSTKAIQREKNRIIQQMASQHKVEARTLLASTEFSTLKQKIGSILNQYSLNYDLLQDEQAIITVKLATKNTTDILKSSMQTTIVIFLNAILLSIIFALISANAISRPIALLRKEMDYISSENLERPIQPKLLKIRGEVGDLARSFNKLKSRLNDTTVSRDQLLLEVERRKQSEKSLKDLAENLAKSNKELDQFAYAASHDLREPLRGIECLSEWIIEDCYDKLPTQSREHLQLLNKRVKRLDALIEGILAYSRATKEQAPSTIDCNQLLKDVIDTVSPTKVSIYIDTPMPVITLNKTMITQIFLNLINNAVKFNDKKEAEIHIGYSLSKKKHQFYVRDNGPGIEAQYFDKIFEIFQTLQSRDAIEGTGIGLALVKKIVENQGGKVWLESSINKGTTFYFTIPFLTKDKAS